MKTRLLVLQATPFCNIDCTYCYLPDRTDRARMVAATATRAIEWLRESSLLSDTLDVLWHAGEPFVLPPSHYAGMMTAMSEAAAPKSLLLHQFQTNATLVSDEWCDFLVTTGSRVGVSIDAPAAAHDRHRLDRHGRSTLDATLRGLAKLLAHGLQPTSISVLTSEALQRWYDVLPWLKKLGLRSVAFNIEETEGAHSSNSVARHHHALLRELANEMWREHSSEDGLRVREISTTLHRLVSPGQVRPIGGEPFAVLSVDTAGGLSTFSPELLTSHHEAYGDFVFGNIFIDTLEDVLASKKYRAVSAAIARGVNLCRRDCEYFSYCGGGEPVNKLFENGKFDSSRTDHCSAMVQTLIDQVLDNAESETVKGSLAAGTR